MTVLTHVLSGDITDIHFSIHDDNTVSLFLVAPVGIMDNNPMAKIKVDRSANIYFSKMNDKWFAKWMCTNSEGTWCGFGGHCKHAHDEREDAIQCAISRYMVFKGAME